MTTGPVRSWRRGAASRLLWAVPLVVAAVAGFVAAVIVLPGVAGRTSVPAELVVHQQKSQPAGSNPTVNPPKKRHNASPAPVTTAPAVITPPPTQPATRVVAPEQPVVRESDDRNEGGTPQDTWGGDDSRTGAESTSTASPSATITPSPNGSRTGDG